MLPAGLFGITIMFKLSRPHKTQFTPKELSIKGEDLAYKFLKKKGYKILKRNYVCKSGEIDIISFDSGTIVFVEVKARQSEIFGPPELAITKEKRRRIFKTALNYLKANKIEDTDFRFDVVSILIEKDQKKPNIRLLKYAFTADGILRK